MNKLIINLNIFFAIFTISTTTQAVDKTDLSANEIMEKVYNVSKVRDSKASLVILLINKNGNERKRESLTYTKLIENSNQSMRLAKFIEPADVRGTKTLMIENKGKDDDIWIYLPALKKVRRLVSNNKKDSYVGTDFSYGDILGYKPQDWTHKILRNEMVEKQNSFVIESKPINNKIAEESGYSKRLTWVHVNNFFVLKSEAFDSNGSLLKKFFATKHKLIDSKMNKWQSMELMVENVQTEHKTKIVYKNFEANKNLSSDIFTSRYLEKQ